jgi:hypothetical protein
VVLLVTWLLISLIAAGAARADVAEQEGNAHGADTFSNYHNASGPGQHIARDQTVQVSCKVYDPTIESVNPDGYWYRIASGPWNNAYYAAANTFYNGDPHDGPYTHNTDASVPDCGSGAPPPPSRQRFDRQRAVAWAHGHVNDRESFGIEDCTWYVSQALWAGGLPKSGDWTGRSYNIHKVASRKHYPGPTKAAVNAQLFRKYVVDAHLATIKRVAWSDNTAGGAQIGDIIAYDWDRPGPDGSIDHVAMVTGMKPSGYPLVSQHSPARRDRGWSWDPSARNWIEFSHTYKNGKRPAVYLIHIID